MRIAIVLSLALLFVPVAVTAAPLALSDHAVATKTLTETNVAVEQVGWRRNARRCGRRYVQPNCCSWTCYPYYRPYQYYYWQNYYPYGGPLFY